MTQTLELVKRDVVDYAYFNLWLEETYPEKFNGLNVSSDDDNVQVIFKDDFTSEEILDITNYHNSLTETDVIETKHVKLYRYIPVDRSYDYLVVPKDVNYKTGLIRSLYPHRIFVKGELQHVYWYSDKDLTDEILRVDIVYVRDVLGFATERTTTRIWIREDGSLHPDIKVTIKDYTLNPTDQTKEGKRRRGNNVDNAIIVTLHFMQQTIPIDYPEKTPYDILLEGRAFQASLEQYILTYINSSDKDIITQVQEATDYWLDNDISSITGVEGQTIRSWLVEELTI